MVMLSSCLVSCIAAKASHLALISETFIWLYAHDLVDCKWGQWTIWGHCSEPCGGGVQHRNRIIIEEAANGGAECKGSNEESRFCNESPCPGKKQIEASHIMNFSNFIF